MQKVSLLFTGFQIKIIQNKLILGIFAAFFSQIMKKIWKHSAKIRGTLIFETKRFQTNYVEVSSQERSLICFSLSTPITYPGVKVESEQWRKNNSPPSTIDKLATFLRPGERGKGWKAINIPEIHILRIFSTLFLSSRKRELRNNPNEALIRGGKWNNGEYNIFE